MDDKFGKDLVRFSAATTYFICGMMTAREMFAKSYFSLGIQEKAAVDQVVLSAVSANFQVLTPELLRAKESQGVGFQAPIS